MGSARTHHEQRRRLRDRLLAAGVDADEVTRRVQEMAEQQRMARGTDAQHLRLPEPLDEQPVPEDRCPKTGKVKRSRQGAKDAMFAHRRRYFSNVQSYKCEACGTWHIGHKPIRKPRRVR